MQSYKGYSSSRGRMSKHHWDCANLATKHSQFQQSVGQTTLVTLLQGGLLFDTSTSSVLSISTVSSVVH